MLLDLRQVKTLTKSFIDRDEDRFFAVFLRLAQREAEMGNDKSAEKLKDIVQRARLEMRSLTRSTDSSHKRSGAGLHILDVSYPQQRLTDIGLDPATELRLLNLIDEQRDFTGLRRRGHKLISKCLLQGASNADASAVPMAVAGELGLPMYHVHLERLLERRHADQLIGLEQVFKVIAAIRGIYVFDNFDLPTPCSEDLDGQPREPSPSWCGRLLEMIARDYWGSLLLFVTSSPKPLNTDLAKLMDAILVIEQTDLAAERINARSWELAPSSNDV